MSRQTVIRAISDCTDQEDQKAGLADICYALGTDPNAGEIKRLTEMLRDGYQGYVSVIRNGGCVRVMPRTHAENARHERIQAMRQQFLLGTVAACLATILGFFMGKYFG